MRKWQSKTKKTAGFERVNKGYNFTTCATPAAPSGKGSQGMSGQEWKYPGPAKSSVWVRQAHGDEEDPRARQSSGAGGAHLFHSTEPRLRSHVPAPTLSRLQASRLDLDSGSGACGVCSGSPQAVQTRQPYFRREKGCGDASCVVSLALWCSNGSHVTYWHRQSLQ